MVGKCALIVDDDSANRSIWELVLLDGGYEVRSTANLESGLSQITADISLYLIDYHLPDGRGTDIVKQVRLKYPSSVVVIISMDDAADVIRETMRAGGNLFIVKPASPLIMTQVLSDIDSGALTADAHQLINRNGRRIYAF